MTRAGRTTMRAVVLERYGGPENLRLAEIETPVPGPGEVLVRVHATAINDWDWGWVRGRPYVFRLMTGLTRPRVSVIGAEVAGTVEAVGEGARSFTLGDPVYGDLSEAGFGGFAEAVAVPEEALVRMPPSMSFEQAAAIPHAAGLALQGLVDVGRIGRGERVLINGAGGGVGILGAQIAKHYDAEVTGVDRDFKLDAMRRVGFDHVIDYRCEDFTRSGRRYDLILDTKTTRSPFAYLRALRDGGRYVTVGGLLRRLLQVAALRAPIERATGKSLAVVALKPNQGLATFGAMFVDNGFECLIDGPFPLSEVPQALRRFGEARHVGKVVITVAAENAPTEIPGLCHPSSRA